MTYAPKRPRNEAIRRMLLCGHSSSRVAAALVTVYPEMTKNVVIGVAHRFGIKIGKNKNGGPAPHTAPHNLPHNSPPRIGYQPKPAKPGTCLFIKGDPREIGWTWCGKPKAGRSYCAVHHALCTQGVSA